MHLHNTAGIAVSAQRDGLLPLSQHAMRFMGHLGYHDYEGLALTESEGAHLVTNLGKSSRHAITQPWNAHGRPHDC
jgi:ribulose-5-phosphate 4-epimerase/fuculose-1-phosphate aldolase